MEPHAKVPITIDKLIVRDDIEFIPSAGTHVRTIGCPEHRNCFVEHYHGTLYFYEKGRKSDGDHIVSIGVDTLFRKMFAAIIKANDGLEMSEALDDSITKYTEKMYLDAHG